VILIIEAFHFEYQLLGRSCWLLGSVVLLLLGLLLLIRIGHLGLLHRVICVVLLIVLSILLLTILLLLLLPITKIRTRTCNTLVNLLSSPSLLLVNWWRELVCRHWGILVYKRTQIGKKLCKIRLIRVPLLHVSDCEHVLLSDVVKSIHDI